MTGDKGETGRLFWRLLKSEMVVAGARVAALDIGNNNDSRSYR